MPIYEYLCNKCKEKFEKLIIEKGNTVKCPKCGSAEVEKQFSSFSGGSSKKTAKASCPSGGCCPGCNLN
ncbi:MAG: zinc ribbon domain-containing protein [Elusimicrobia bacterium]|nr:zinc ribbon domain-containing protein [Elusimicrobiota bacterium]